MEASSDLVVHPIGVIRTPFQDRYHAPRQGSVEPTGAEGLIVLEPGRNLEQAAQDLQGFEKIWLIVWFHRNKTWKPKILPPRSPHKKRGVFATRSPHRPNPLGLTVADLLEVKGREIRVRGVDLLDGTPILDLKPYLPYADAFPHARIGWLEEVEQEARRGPRLSIAWEPRAQAQADFLRCEFGIELAGPAEQVLQGGTAPHPYRRISRLGTGRLQLALKSWRIVFTAAEASVRIQEVASGYVASALAAAKPGTPLHDQAAHVAFHARWPQKL